jgi:alpha-D-ribose 1-methylphosphonate 5-triphosphate synthase subunit PhnH
MAEQGFANPVFDSQRIFRASLTALAEPGRIMPIKPACIPPTGLDAAAVAMALALCDGDTPLWLCPSLRGAADFFRFHTGSPIVAGLEDASFAIATAAQRPPLAALRAGTADYPDRSATLILAVSDLTNVDGWRLSGPGIAGTRSFQPRPIDDGFVAEWRENHARFPLGIDILFAAEDRVAGLPRSCKLEV